MPPACGVGITSIPRECDLNDNLRQCSAFHKQSNCNKPSQKPKISLARDHVWKTKKKPELFFDSRRYLVEARLKKDLSPRGANIEDEVQQKGISVTAAACAGGSEYCTLLMRQLGY